MNKAVHYDTASINKAYARVAWFYDAWGGMTEAKALRKVREFAVIRNGESVLEVAVGTGRNFAHVVRANPDGRNAGLDISQAMLAVAKRKLRPYQQYELTQGDASSLPYEDSSFDALLNCFMLDLLPQEDYPVILAEFKRVLKPDGRLVISTMTYGREWYSKPWDAIARWFPALLTNCRPVDIESVLNSSGFLVDKKVYITQNTFPSLVLHALST